MDLKKLFGCKSGKSNKGRASRKNGFVESVECGVYALDFYYDEENIENCKVEVRCGAQMEVTLTAYHDGYGFLMSCQQDGAKDAMEAYCAMLWQCSYLLSVDEYFPKRVLQSWQKHNRAIEKKAQEAAAADTEAQNEADEALMNEAVKVAEMSESERNEYSDKVKGQLKDALKNKKKKV